MFALEHSYAVFAALAWLTMCQRLSHTSFTLSDTACGGDFYTYICEARARVVSVHLVGLGIVSISLSPSLYSRFVTYLTYYFCAEVLQGWLLINLSC